jgi:hypothetical protein
VIFLCFRSGEKQKQLPGLTIVRFFTTQEDLWMAYVNCFKNKKPAIA